MTVAVAPTDLGRRIAGNLIVVTVKWKDPATPDQAGRETALKDSWDLKEGIHGGLRVTRFQKQTESWDIVNTLLTNPVKVGAAAEQLEGIIGEGLKLGQRKPRVLFHSFSHLFFSSFKPIKVSCALHLNRSPVLIKL